MKTPLAAIILALAALPAAGQNVKITPIGSHPGELCANDRAIVFEDPTGVRLLYDPAHNVTGGDDPRLGTIHAVLLFPHARRPCRQPEAEGAGRGHVRELGKGAGTEFHDG